ncbi:MAG TPA: FlgD immunoglobulin-like domain containing protein [Candidatus Cloacimonadota bacterium]|nr:FlgD immunoglobulin-like domain containing protein [Candidatus Cloacimonadota bacterium]
MKKIMLFLLLFFSVALFAQTVVSQVNYLGDFVLNDLGFNPVFSTVDTDGSLNLFDWTYDSNNITVRRVTCSHDGEFTPVTEVLNFYSSSAWGSVPVFVDAFNKGLYTYFIIKTNNRILIIARPDISLGTFPDFRVTENHGLSASDNSMNHHFLGNNLYYVSTSDHQLYCYDLDTNTQTVLLPYTEQDMRLAALGDDYLYIYVPWNQDFNYIIDSTGSMTNLEYDNPYTIAYVSDTDPDIGGGIYPTSWNDGLLKSSTFGYVKYIDGQFDLVGLGGSNDFTPSDPFPTNYIPLGNQRVICRVYEDTNLSYFKTYMFENDVFNNDTNFPCISATINPANRLFKVGDRYIVGVSVPSDNTRKFICIDLDQQTIQTSVDSMEFSLSDYNFTVTSGFNRIYYVYGNEIREYVIERVTSNPDIVQPTLNISSYSYPNPFRLNTDILLKGNQSNPELSIFNIRGQLVRKLEIRDKSASDKKYSWDGRDNSGRMTPAGVYLYQVVGDNKHKFSGKMVKVE